MFWKKTSQQKKVPSTPRAYLAVKNFEYAEGQGISVDIDQMENRERRLVFNGFSEWNGLRY